MLFRSRAAPLGDDVLGDEPTVARLEAMVAQRLGKEAAVFVPSGTMANQLAIRTACGAGDEIVAHEDSHIIHYETGAPAALAGAMVRTVRGAGGLFDAADVRAAVRTKNVHHPVSRMLVAENTQNRGGGTVWPMDRWERVAAEARSHGMHVHVDGARLFNACVAGGYAAADFARHADTVSVCFSKGLGCPVGSALVGPAAFLERARRFRKMFGGGMRQSGLLAAAAAAPDLLPIFVGLQTALHIAVALRNRRSRMRTAFDGLLMLAALNQTRWTRPSEPPLSTPGPVRS